jgi:hypothetical protein
LLEKAIWEVLQKERFSVMPVGRIDGGARVVVAAVKQKLESSYEDAHTS